MSITYTSLVSSPGSREGEQDRKFDRTYKTEFIVHSNDINDDPSYILSNFAYGGSPLPIGSKYPGDATAYCISRRASLKEVTEGATGALWNFTATYGPWDPFVVVENPLNVPVLPSIEGQTFEKVADYDKDGNPILNSAGDAYNPPLTKTVTHLMLRFSKNYATLPSFFAYVDYINNDTWQTFAPFMVKFNMPRAEELPSQYLASTYWKFDFEFEVNPDGWLNKLTDWGFNQIVSTKKVPILVAGHPPTEPQFLDGSGVVLTPPVTHTNIVTNTFHVRKETAFGTLFSAFPTNLFDVYAFP